MADFVKVRTRLAVARELRRSHGFGLVEAHRLAAVVDDDLIATAVDSAPDEVRAAFVAATGVVGGPLADLLTKFLEFLNSPLGQALLKLIISLLLGV